MKHVPFELYCLRWTRIVLFYNSLLDHRFTSLRGSLSFTLKIHRRRETKENPENENIIKKNKTEIKKTHKITRTKVSLSFSRNIIFFIDVAFAKIVISCNNYNLCVYLEGTRMKTEKRFSSSTYYKIMNLLFLSFIVKHLRCCMFIHIYIAITHTHFPETFLPYNLCFDGPMCTYLHHFFVLSFLYLLCMICLIFGRKWNQKKRRKKNRKWNQWRKLTLWHAKGTNFNVMVGN